MGLSLDEKESLYNVFVLHVQDSGEIDVDGRITETDQELQTHTFGTFDDIQVELSSPGYAVLRSGSPSEPLRMTK